MKKAIMHNVISQFAANISDGIDGSVIAYMIMYYSSTRSRKICDLAIVTVSPSFCTGLICRHVFDVSTSFCHSSTEIAIAAVATNVLGNGPESSPVYITIATSHFHNNCSEYKVIINSIATCSIAVY